MDGDGGEELPSSPFFFITRIYEWLNNALYYGISETEFWNMTLAEINRAIDVKKKVQKEELQLKASMDYILADLIGRSIARIHSSSAKLPTLVDSYPTLFNKEEINEKIQEKKDELSALRIKQFAQSFNSRFKEVGTQNG